MAHTACPPLKKARHLHPSDAGRMIVTDLEFWHHDPAWKRNYDELRYHGAVFAENVNLFCLGSSLSHLPIQLEDIALVVVGGFHPHYMTSPAVQALAHQLPRVEIMMLYASRDTPPDYQDRNLVHVQGWTADAANNYVIRIGGAGSGGHSRCYTAETLARGVASDPALVKISFFTRNVQNVHMTGALISPSASVQAVLRAGRHVLFCAEGDAALARSCLEIPPSPAPSFFAQANRFFEGSGKVDSYIAFMQSAKDQGVMTVAEAARTWGEAWPIGDKIWLQEWSDQARVAETTTAVSDVAADEEEEGGS